MDSKLLRILGNYAENNYPTLSKDEEYRLFEAYANGSQSARDTIICHNILMVFYIVRNEIRLGTFSFSDVVSEGLVCLVKCVDSFDYTSGNRFSTYAYISIKRACYQYRNRKECLLHIPTNVVDVMHGTSSSTLNGEANAQYARNISKLEGDVIFNTGNGCSTDTWFDLNHYAYDKDIEQSPFDEVLTANLTDREKKIITARYTEELTLESVGEYYDITRERVRQIERAAINKLKHNPILRQMFEDSYAR